MSPLIRRFDAADEYYFEEGCYIHELSNSPDDPLMSVARARLPLGGQTRWHRLHNVVERYLIEAGEGMVELGEHTPQRVSAGDVVVIPAGCPQRIRCIGEQPLVFLAICTPRFEPACYEDVDA
ncbi:cupin domain-containing protein [Halopseudomonas pachastrellae]|jgi:mannose-6-phosphate isomerase-like protein (cupin superfamily)|nr:cupin domain-containing protein [Halopseudomonas pachastrellae]MED5493241.1 cupin domain-containing protein [Pseudomonadota bacterium]WVM87638.1 cupin domain-containing protein [Halopseudomonas pachastrellae]